MNCKNFRDRIFLFQADELPESERAECQSHLDACEGCAARLRFEDAALDALRGGLGRTAAPPGLEERIRSSLRGATATRVPWYRAGAFAATATAALLALLLLLPQLRRPGGPASAAALVHGVVTVVDLDCDRAGKDLAHQRRCLDPHHVNALKHADGSYWTMDASRPEFRYLLLDRDRRGEKLRVAGRMLLGTSVIRLQSVEPLDARHRPRALPAARRGDGLRGSVVHGSLKSGRAAAFCEVNADERDRGSQ